METERKRILSMLKNGAISMDEALTLLEQLDSTQTTESSTPVKQAPSNEQEESKEQTEESSQTTDEDFFKHMREEFNTMGSRFMQAMQTTVQKVKEFDFEGSLSSFSQGTSVSKTLTFDAESVKKVAIDIANGKAEIRRTKENELTVEATLKGFNQEEENLQQRLDHKVILLTDGNELRIISSLKTSALHVVIYLPTKAYEKISAQLGNCPFTVKGTMVEEIEVETLSGRIYIDCDVKEVEAETMNGAIAITTKHPQAEKIEAKTANGSVELYVPQASGLVGEASTNLGQITFHMDDLTSRSDQEQFLQRSVHFRKVSDSDEVLQIKAEAKTGSIQLHYN